jgi:hypothetical protein
MSSNLPGHLDTAPHPGGATTGSPCRSRPLRCRTARRGDASVFEPVEAAPHHPPGVGTVQSSSAGLTYVRRCGVSPSPVKRQPPGQCRPPRNTAAGQLAPMAQWRVMRRAGHALGRRSCVPHMLKQVGSNDCQGQTRAGRERTCARDLTNDRTVQADAMHGCASRGIVLNRDRRPHASSTASWPRSGRRRSQLRPPGGRAQGGRGIKISPVSVIRQSLHLSARSARYGSPRP